MGGCRGVFPPDPLFPPGGRGRGGEVLYTKLDNPYYGDNMGKGPGTIYKDCLAIARRTDKELANDRNNNDLLRDFNLKFKVCCLFEKDIRMTFFKENYSTRTTEKALNQWVDLDLITRIPYKGYKVVLFNDTITSIQGA